MCSRKGELLSRRGYPQSDSTTPGEGLRNELNVNREISKLRHYQFF
jgi:hypothetical protein